MANDEEKADIERRIRAGIVTRLYDLAAAGGAGADGLANRVAAVANNFVIDFDGSGNAITRCGNQSCHFLKSSLDTLVRSAFAEAPEFKEEAAVWEDRRSKQSGRNPQTVTGLFPKTGPAAESARQQAERGVANHRNMVSGSL